MTNDEIKELVTKQLESQDVFKCYDVTDVNHKPHPYTIGPKHIKYASEHHSGGLGEETCRAVGCAVKGCNMTYDEHTSDKVVALQLLRDATNLEMHEALQSTADLGNGLFDGFVFIESEFKVIDNE